MTFFYKLSSVVGVLGFVSGLGGFGKIWVLGIMLDSNLISFHLHLFLSSRTLLVEPHLIDAEFRKAWMPFFCWSGHPVVTSDQFLKFVGHLLPQEPYLDLPRITGRDLQEVARA